MSHRGRRNADDTLVALLASGVSVAEASVTAGVSSRTVFRRLKDGTFVERVRQARAAITERTLAKLTDAGCEAADVLRALLISAPPAVKLGAARAILELAGRLREATETEARLAALEQQQFGDGTQ
jgi:hypothetical protein